MTEEIYKILKQHPFRRFSEIEIDQELRGRGTSLNTATIYRNLRRILKYDDIKKVKKGFVFIPPEEDFEAEKLIAEAQELNTTITLEDTKPRNLIIQFVNKLKKW